jgi:ribosome-associated protein
MTNNLDSGLDHFIKAIQERKAFDIVVLDVGPLSSVAETFIICSGRSNRQVTAIAENIQRAMKKQGIKPLSVEGKSTGHWILMDYGHIVIHVFFTETRGVFDLESLWNDAARTEIPNPTENFDNDNHMAASVIDDDDWP